MTRESASRPKPGVSTIVETLLWRAEHHPDQRCFTFVADDGGAETHLTYSELFARARIIAGHLQRLDAAGERALLLYPPGLEYAAAIYGCLCAGTVAVPAYPPRPDRPPARVESLAADAQPKVVLTTSAIRSGLEGRLADTPGLARIPWVATDTLTGEEGGEWVRPSAREDALALLQYTSGSTRQPKGVMVSHGNLQHNMALICSGFQMSEADQGMLWLPSYHDMGLVGGILVPPYVGFPVALMSPAAFLQRPVRWLQSIARYRATISGAPNFAYDLCVERTTAEERRALDLSRWRVAFCGAEPLRASSLDRFAAAFSGAGFRRAAFYPCYGLAETTLIATGGHGPGVPVLRTVLRDELERHRVAKPAAGGERAHTLVGCGQAMPGLTVTIVDPDTRQRCAPGRVGEIWVSGPSVTRGYWDHPAETELSFRAQLAGDGKDVFLRTGDLGFLEGGELFVTGRLKDLIVIGGRNYHPQDIEATVEQSHAALQAHGGAAFSVEVDGTERLVVVQEVKRSALRALAADEVLPAIRDAVAREHDLPVHAVALVRPLNIPRTSSGKAKRYACREAFLAGGLETVAAWPATGAAAAPQPAPALPVRDLAAEIQGWLVAHISTVSGIAPGELDVNRPFAYYGLGSLQAVSLTGELEQWLGRRVSPTLPYDYPTIAALAHHLATGAEASNVTAPAVVAATAEPVAVIGMACRFPGAPDLEAFWNLLESGGDAIGEIPAARRALWERYAEGAERAGDSFPSRGGFLGTVDSFDPHFFGITPREAASIDPQQRLLLELASEALEDAGQPLEPLRGARAGVFVGISSSDYSRLRGDDPGRTDPYAGTGNALSMAANRISYVLDLRGPSLAVDTACSSSLVAVHLACQSLRTGQCGLALAGGVNLILSPAVTATFAKSGFLSPDGRCKAFDARADGYVRGEGAGVVVLKPLSRALADGDRIYAVVRGSAVNSDGRTNGLTAPSRHAQEAVLRDAYADAGVAPAQVQYVEAHGTGTALGDPIEAEALGNVLAAGRPAGERCAIGSVKTNIGHLEAAAGIAGLIKTVLALARGTIPPSLHFREANPHIPFDRLPLAVQQTPGAWPRGREPARAGVSSFGFGGTNAHVVLEQAPAAAAAAVRGTNGGDSRPWVLPLSAASPEALRAQAQRLREWLASAHPPAEWPDVCYSAGVRRSHHEHRLAFAAHEAREAVELLDAFVRGEPSPRLVGGRAARQGRPSLVFVFPGQGPQWWAMGRELLEHDPVFQSAMDACDRALRRHAGWSVREALAADERASRLDETRFAQPALVALQVALAACWRHWGIVPDAVVGHSLGEVAAAHVGGVLSLEDAMRLAYERGRVMQKAAGQGRMAAAELPAREVEAVIAAHGAALSIAAVNGPRQTVVSGDPAALGDVLRSLRARGVRCHELPGDHAFHSAQMAALTPELARALQGLQPRPASVPVIASAGGGNGDGFGVCYWQSQIERPVRFADAIDRLFDAGHRLFLEIGPHPVLSSCIVECLRERSVEGRALPTLRRGAEDRATMLGSLAALHVEGYPIDWRRLYPAGGRLATLPSYPWQRERCWIDGEPPPAPATRTTPGHGDGRAHPLLGRRVELAAFAGAYVWENDLDHVRHAYLQDHRFQGMALVPGTAYFELAVAAATDGLGKTPSMLRRIQFRHPLFLPPEGSRTLQVVLEPGADGRWAFRIFSRPSGPIASAAVWTLHAVGEVDHAAQDAPHGSSSPEELTEIQRRCREPLTGEAHFAELRQRGFDYGPAFQGLTELWRRPGEALGRLRVPDVLQAELPAYHLHPAILDAGAQLLVSADSGRGRPFLPLGVETVKVYPRRGQPDWGHASIRSDTLPGAQGFVGDIRLLDSDRNVLVEALGLRVQYMDGDTSEALAPPADSWLYALEWEAKARPGGDAVSPRGTWLVLADGGGVGDALASRLREEGNRCLVVRAGARNEPVDGGCVRARPGEAADLRQALEDAAPSAASPLRGVVHLWSLDAAPAEAADTSAVAAAQALGTATAVGIVQALTLAAGHPDARLWLVTRGAQAIGQTRRPVQAPQAPLWGLGRTLLQEQPSLAGGLLDLDPEGPAEEAATALLREMLAPDGESQVAFRDGARYVARLARWRPAAAPEPVRLRADASYLVTGGLGGLGLSVARWMIQQGARRLILLGRSALPPRAEWGAVDADSRLAGQIAAIRRLEAEGASVHLASVDVSDEAQLGAFLDTFRREGWPEIRGVVHAAGVVQDEIVPRLDAPTLGAVSRAKVAGGWLLHRSFTGPSLDFFVLFSSAAALLGSPGQGSYAAANAFLDGLAHLRRALGQKALSINWGPWAEVGMAARGDGSSRFAEQGIGSLRPEEALDVFGRLLSEPVVQVGVIPIRWARLAQAFPAVRTAPLFARLVEEQPLAVDSAGGPATASVREALLAAEASERPRLVETLVREYVAKLAGLAPGSIEGDQPLNALGIDSLMSIDLKNRLERALGVVIPVIRLLEVPTLAGLVGVLVEELERSAKPAATRPAPNDSREKAPVPAATPIVAVRAGGPKPPLFCVHPGALDVQGYAELAGQLGGDRPFHALQPRALDGYHSLDGASPPDTSIEEVAASCMAALKAVQPHGPYYLGGWSLGGVVAFEIAQQLRDGGETVGLLAMFDTPSPATGERPDDYDDGELVRMFAGYLGARRGRPLALPADAGGSGPSDQLGRLLQLATAAGALPPDTDAVRMRSLFEAYKNGLRTGTRLLWRYRPRVYPGPMTYFRAVEEVAVLEKLFPRATATWASLTSAAVEVHEVPGSHYTMFMEPHVGELARRLRECLRTAASVATPAVAPPPRPAGKEAGA